jgi:hypothetical protein
LNCDKQSKFSLFFWNWNGWSYLKSLDKLTWLDQLANQTHQYYDNVNGHGPSLASRYITAFYFTLSSLTSVGFGNISANTNSEKVFTILVMLVGCKWLFCCFCFLWLVSFNLFTFSSYVRVDFWKRFGNYSTFV